MALLQALVAAAVTAVAAGLRIATMPGSSLYQNPVLNASAPDPGVLFDPATGLYWAAVTSNDDPNHFPLYSSPDLVSWTAQGVLFPAGDEPVWAKQMNRDWWAPEVHIMPDGSYVAYYVTRNNDGVLSIGAAVSASRSMAGPWVDIGQPLIASKPDGQIGAFRNRVGDSGGSGRRGVACGSGRRQQRSRLPSCRLWLLSCAAWVSQSNSVQHWAARAAE
jgi:hypothetical protein